MGRLKSRTEWLEPHYRRYMRFWFDNLRTAFLRLRLSDKMSTNRLYEIVRGDPGTPAEVEAVRAACRKYATDNKLPERREL